MRTAAQWKEDLDSFLGGSLVPKGFTGRAFFPNSSEPLAFFSLLAYSLYLHSKITYPIHDYLQNSWKSIQPILDFGQEVYSLGYDPEWWGRWGTITVERVAELFDAKNYLLEKVRRGEAVTFNDSEMLNVLVSLLKLSIIWIEDQAEAPLIHQFTPSNDNELALYVFLFQSDRSLSLLYHRDMDLKEGGRRLPFYMIVGEPSEHFEIGHLAGQPQSLEIFRAAATEEAAKTMERKVTEAALAVVIHCYQESIPTQADASVNHLREAISNYQSVSILSKSAPLDLSLAHRVLSEAPIRRKGLPVQHTLRECRSSQVPGELAQLTCGHDFHYNCLQVYINLQVGKASVPCPYSTCPHEVSPAWVSYLAPKYYEDTENAKSTTLLQAQMGQSPLFAPANPTGFRCPQCGEAKDQKAAHACLMCSDCLVRSIMCGACGQPLNEQDRLILQSTLSRR